MNHDRGPRASNEVVESRTYVQISTELIISCVLITYPTKERNGDGSGSDVFRDPVCATDGSVPAHFKFSTSRCQNLPPLFFFFPFCKPPNFHRFIASKKTDIKPGKAGKALRDVSSETKWLLARAAKRQLDKQALEAEVAKLEKWISDDVEKAAGWKITAEKLTNKEAGSSIDELFAAALEKKKAEEAEPSDVKAEPSSN
ncbi:hypothetical protein FocnCong_v012319 [Fusarium oxysporum f. sp. conglutinans]|nr:hypothetical protein FocnCong_v012319 [Fusarium oxysporum f. sp. conglutinans]